MTGGHRLLPRLVVVAYLLVATSATGLILGGVL